MKVARVWALGAVAVGGSLGPVTELTGAAEQARRDLTDSVSRPGPAQTELPFHLGVAALSFFFPCRKIVRVVTKHK